jgi:hypothetical protein
MRHTAESSAATRARWSPRSPIRLFSVAPFSSASADEAKVQCTGVNACKGQSACKSASNACKGQNSCKGQGFKELTQKQCDAAKAKKN